MSGLNIQNVQYLRSIARGRGVVGYSKMKKAQLIACIDSSGSCKRRVGYNLPGNGVVMLARYTVKDLKVEAKKLGIAGYSKMRKEKLIKSIVTSNHIRRNTQGSAYKRRPYEEAW